MLGEGVGGVVGGGWRCWGSEGVGVGAGVRGVGGGGRRWKGYIF